MAGSRPIALLPDTHAIIMCEGTAEDVILQKLLAKGRFILPERSILGITKRISAKRVQGRFLDLDYPFPVCIIRLIDSRKERFELGNLYKGRFRVYNVLTCPEIEMLAIIREGRYADFTTKNKQKLRPSDYCRQVLGMRHIKERSFLESYWDVASIVSAANDYRSLKQLGGDERCLADVIL